LTDEQQSPQQSTSDPWPSAVSRLAVAAHISVALALWRSSNSAASVYPHVIIAVVLLLAQANLLTLWLLLGSSPWPRRIAWALCGWSGIAFVLSSGERFGSVDAFPIAVQPAVTGIVLLYWRLRGFRLVGSRPFGQSGEPGREARGQFSIMELFGAALGVAIAAGLWIRIDDLSPFRLHSRQHEYFLLLILSLPMALFTLAAARGMRASGGLLPQVILAGVILLLAICFPLSLQWRFSELFLVHSAHWFTVAATLAVFERCGCRLALEPPASDR
jgi:hypothetical protein